MPASAHRAGSCARSRDDRAHARRPARRRYLLIGGLAGVLIATVIAGAVARAVGREAAAQRAADLAAVAAARVMHSNYGRLFEPAVIDDEPNPRHLDKQRSAEVGGSWTGFTDRPAFADARRVADGLVSAYVDDKVDRVEVFYNGYISPVNQEVRHETLLPLQQADVIADDDEDSENGENGENEDEHIHDRALWIYEPDAEEILARLVPDYVEISIYRAMLESTASEHGARMSAMRSASDNAAELIDDLTLAANRQRQAEITQEIMEVVAGAEGLR